MMRKATTLALILSVFAAVPARAQEATPSPTPTPQPAPAYVDIDGHWAEAAIRYTAVENDWTRLPGTRFSPDHKLSRQFLAFALVRALAPDATPSPERTFTDLPATSPYFPYANIAVGRGWLLARDGAFDPTGDVLKDHMSRAVGMALGLKAVATGINAIRTTDGYRFKHSAWLGYRTIGQQLRLYWNRPNDGPKELWPQTALTRGDLAYAVSAAVNAGWRVWSLQRFADIRLPDMGPVKRKMVEFALRYSAFPYHWGGNGPTLMDCSGYARWVLRDESPNDSLRGYDGWPLPERASYQMATIRPHVGYSYLRVGDLVFWDDEGAYQQKASSVDHVGIWLGNGWFIHQSGGRAGVSLDWMGDGWWRDRLVWGRHIISS